MTITLLKGSDPVLLEDAAVTTVREAMGEAVRSEVFDEFRGDEYELGEVCLAANTFSMFGDRVVAARNLSRFSVEELSPLLELLADLPGDVTLVLVWDKPTTPGIRANPVPRKVTDAVKAAGGDVIDTTPPRGGRARGNWLSQQFDAANVSIDGAARARIEEHIGEELGRLPALLELIAAANPSVERVGLDEVQPFLGEGGGVPPWDLTDAIDAGDTAQSVELVRRMTGAGERHPLAVMSTLQTHYDRMLRLDGAGVRDEKTAAALLGMKGSTYPAKKAMTQCGRLGHGRIIRAIQLLAQADLDFKGATGAPAEAVIELLVARLAALGGPSRAPKRRR